MNRSAPKLCPICQTENTGGLPHRWHKVAHRKKAYGLDRVAEMAQQTIEANQVRLIVGAAVDASREPDDWDPGATRAAYHRAYYARNIERRRQQARDAKRARAMLRNLRPLIAGLCHAVDLGRLTARW
jgi:hypothetical protein